jgi:HlyD family secretion protein
MKQILSLFILSLTLHACAGGNDQPDASGTFEAEETIVSAETSGRLLRFEITEGDSVTTGQVVARIDTSNLALQKEQIEASIDALSEKTSDVLPQIRLLNDQLQVQASQLNHLMREKKRTERLVAADAATGKQLDDLQNQIDVLQAQMLVTKQQINVQRTSTNTQNRSILSERGPLQKRREQLQDQLAKSSVINPVNGVVLTTYAETGEFTSAGKALYKVADLSHLNLRAYITGSQLPGVRLNDTVTVLVDDGPEKYKAYRGTISWISDKAEFTPKSIQTKEERANLVYAIKIRVPNDGYLKLGMYADVKLKTADHANDTGN